MTKERKEVNQGKEGINQDKEGSQLREGRKMTKERKDDDKGKAGR